MDYRADLSHSGIQVRAQSGHSGVDAIRQCIHATDDAKANFAEQHRKETEANTNHHVGRSSVRGPFFGCYENFPRSLHFRNMNPAVMQLAKKSLAFSLYHSHLRGKSAKEIAD